MNGSKPEKRMIYDLLSQQTEESLLSNEEVAALKNLTILNCKNGFDIKPHIRHNVDSTQSWIYFEVYRNEKLVYSHSDQWIEYALKKVYQFIDNESHYEEDYKRFKASLSIKTALRIQSKGE